MTIREYTKQGVQKYLRTILLVDDKLYDSKSQMGIADFSVPSMPNTSNLETSNAQSVAEPVDAVHANTERVSSNVAAEQFSPLAIVDGFAKQGIVCGLYQPPTSDFSGRKIPKRLIELCDRADVFILDWDLKDDRAKSPVPMLFKRLLRKDEKIGSPKPIRFCAIYTERPLDSVYYDLYKVLRKSRWAHLVKKDDTNRIIRLGGLTIRLYSKNKQLKTRGNQSPFVPSSILAKKIIHDFSSEYEGIMSATALRGIAEVRNNAKRILDKFPKGMDSALVLHAGLTMPDAAISKDITSLLSDETAAILTDTQVPSEDIYTLCHEYIERECPDDLLTLLKDTPDIVPQGISTEDIRNFFVQVFVDKALPARTKVFEACKKKLRLHKVDVGLLMALASLVRKKIAPDTTYRFGELSALFCQKTNYGSAKLLRLGTIVSTGVEGIGASEYYLCLMPTCDSLRLQDIDKKTKTKLCHRFPFWRLEKVKSDHQGRNHGVMLLNGDEYVPYCVKGKIRCNFAIYEFHSQGGVVQFDDASCVSTSDGHNTFQWVAELKTSHAQRIAEFVSREFSRVGLVESEWLRLQVDR